MMLCMLPPSMRMTTWWWLRDLRRRKVCSFGVPSIAFKLIYRVRGVLIVEPVCESRAEGPDEGSRSSSTMRMCKRGLHQWPCNHFSSQ